MREPCHYLQLRLHENKPSKIEIKDLNGIVMYSSMLTEEEAEIGQSLPKGIYFMTIVSNGKTAAKRLVKK